MLTLDEFDCVRQIDDDEFERSAQFWEGLEGSGSQDTKGGLHIEAAAGVASVRAKLRQREGLATWCRKCEEVVKGEEVKGQNDESIIRQHHAVCAGCGGTWHMQCVPETQRESAAGFGWRCERCTLPAGRELVEDTVLRVPGRSDPWVLGSPLNQVRPVRCPLSIGGACICALRDLTSLC